MAFFTICIDTFSLNEDFDHESASRRMSRTATMRGSCASPGLAGEPTPADQLRTKRETK
jgi:hypothetical protein